jgi:hypothetical protein
MAAVEVISVEPDGYYSDDNISGSTVKVTMQRGTDLAMCEGIVLWEEEYADSDLFDEWVQCAMNREEGYTAMIEEGDRTVLYCA